MHYNLIVDDLSVSFMHVLAMVDIICVWNLGHARSSVFVESCELDCDLDVYGLKSTCDT